MAVDLTILLDGSIRLLLLEMNSMQEKTKTNCRTCFNYRLISIMKICR